MFGVANNGICVLELPIMEYVCNLKEQGRCPHHCLLLYADLACLNSVTQHL